MRLTVFFFLILSAMGISAWAEDERRIVVRGEGAVAVAPDMAVLSLGVEEEDKSADRAMAAAAEGMGRIMDALARFEVPEQDLQTSTVSLQPVWDHRSGNEVPRVRGYRASILLTVRLRDLGLLGPVLDAVTGAGANRMHGLTFDLQAPGTADDAARRAAVADAVAQATILAEAAGVKLGAVMRIDADGGGMARPMMMEAAMRSGDGVPVASGEVTVSQSVRMVFAIE